MNTLVKKPLRTVSLALCIAIGGMIAAPAAFAFGGGAPTDTHACPKGYVWNGKKCVRAHAGVMPDKDLIEQARQLAVTGHYEEAIGVLEVVSRQDDPLALTYLGYSHRKLGDVDRGIALYQQALAIDPNSTVTREYLGEGYAESGKVDLARQQLAEVEKLCGGTMCEEYRDLAEAIEHAEAK